MDDRPEFTGESVCGIVPKIGVRAEKLVGRTEHVTRSRHNSQAIGTLRYIVLRLVADTVLVAIMLFASAGTFAWWRAWVLLAVMLVVRAVGALAGGSAHLPGARGLAGVVRRGDLCGPAGGAHDDSHPERGAFPSTRATGLRGVHDSRATSSHSGCLVGDHGMSRVSAIQTSSRRRRSRSGAERSASVRATRAVGCDGRRSSGTAMSSRWTRRSSTSNARNEVLVTT